MLTINDLYIVNICHKNCVPLKNIVRLPVHEAFALANELAANNPETTAFYRFADFTNYYTLRMEQDAYLYNEFISLGGTPLEKHPLSFVLQGSDYLDQWFGNGIVTKFRLEDIPSEYVSFTLGDSGATYKRDGTVIMYTKDTLYSRILDYAGEVDEFLREMTVHHYYIEVQLWNDKCLGDLDSKINQNHGSPFTLSLSGL